MTKIQRYTTYKADKINKHNPLFTKKKKVRKKRKKSK